MKDNWIQNQKKELDPLLMLLATYRKCISYNVFTIDTVYHAIKYNPLQYGLICINFTDYHTILLDINYRLYDFHSRGWKHRVDTGGEGCFQGLMGTSMSFNILIVWRWVLWITPLGNFWTYSWLKILSKTWREMLSFTQWVIKKCYLQLLGSWDPGVWLPEMLSHHHQF